MHKGQAAKLYNAEAKGIKYALLFGEHNIINTEGMLKGLPTRRPIALSEADPVTHGLLAQVQDIIYDNEEAEAKAAVARNDSAKSKATKRIVASRSIDFTFINYQAISNMKKFAIVNEKNNEEEKLDNRSLNISNDY